MSKVDNELTINPTLEYPQPGGNPQDITPQPEQPENNPLTRVLTRRRFGQAALAALVAAATGISNPRSTIDQTPRPLSPINPPETAELSPDTLTGDKPEADSHHEAEDTHEKEHKISTINLVSSLGVLTKFGDIIKKAADENSHVELGLNTAKEMAAFVGIRWAALLASKDKTDHHNPEHELLELVTSFPYLGILPEASNIAFHIDVSEKAYESIKGFLKQEKVSEVDPKRPEEIEEKVRPMLHASTEEWEKYRDTAEKEFVESLALLSAMSSTLAPIATTYASSAAADKIFTELANNFYEMRLAGLITENKDNENFILELAERKALEFTDEFVNSPQGLVRFILAYSSNSAGSDFGGDPPLVPYAARNGIEEWIRTSATGEILKHGLLALDVAALALSQGILTPKNTETFAKEYADSWYKSAKAVYALPGMPKNYHDQAAKKVHQALLGIRVAKTPEDEDSAIKSLEESLIHLKGGKAFSFKGKEYIRTWTSSEGVRGSLTRLADRIRGKNKEDIRQPQSFDETLDSFIVATENLLGSHNVNKQFSRDFQSNLKSIREALRDQRVENLSTLFEALEGFDIPIDDPERLEEFKKTLTEQVGVLDITALTKDKIGGAVLNNQAIKNAILNNDRVEIISQLNKIVDVNDVKDAAKDKDGFSPEEEEAENPSNEVFGALATQLWAVSSMVVTVEYLLSSAFKDASAETKTGLILAASMGISGVADNVAAYLFAEISLHKLMEREYGATILNENPALREELNKWALFSAVAGGALTKLGNGPNFSQHKHILELIGGNLEVTKKHLPLAETIKNPYAAINALAVLMAGTGFISSKLPEKNPPQAV